MDEYLYIIVGVIALIINIYRKAQKKKIKVPVPETNYEQTQERPFVPENSPTDLIDEFDKIFGNKENTTEIEESHIEINKDIVDANFAITKEVPKQKTSEIIKTPKNKLKFNVRDAIIYKTILERKY